MKADKRQRNKQRCQNLVLYEDMIDHRSYNHKKSNCGIKDWKKFPLNGIRNHDLCDTGAVLYQLSYHAIRGLVTLLVRNIPVEGEECIWI